MNFSEYFTRERREKIAMTAIEIALKFALNVDYPSYLAKVEEYSMADAQKPHRDSQETRSDAIIHIVIDHNANDQIPSYMLILLSALLDYRTR